MAYFFDEQSAGWQPIANTETTQLHRAGTIVKAFDPTYGEGEFIYLKGVASTIVGNAVVWDTSFQTTLTVLASRGPVGIAMSANVANQWGWYQIAGLAVVKTATVAANAGGVCSTATGGQLDDAATAGSIVDGAATKTADGTPSAGFAVIALSRPCMNAR